MPELLKFEFRRLSKSIFFKIVGGYCIVWPLIVTIFYRILFGLTMKEAGTSFAAETMKDSEIMYLTWMIGVAFVNELPKFIALFACLHVGRDFTDGIVRNKIIAGHSRTAIFFSYMITQLSAVVIWCLLYMSFSWLGLLVTGFGVNLNGGEMLLRYGVAIILTLMLAVTFVVLSVIFRRRALPIILSIIIVMVMSTLTSFAGMFNTPSKAVDDYLKKRDEKYEELIESEILTADDVKELKKYYNKDHYLSLPWKICHPAYLITTAGFNGDYSTDVVSALLGSAEYEDEIDYSVSLCGDEFFGNPDYSGLTPADFKNTKSMHMSYSTLNLIYSGKALAYILCIGGSGYFIFRKKNLF